MPMQQSLMEIQVYGFTGDGKTHVCEVIEKALIAEYGFPVRVINREDRGEANKPRKNVIFAIKEFNHGSMATSPKD